MRFPHFLAWLLVSPFAVAATPAEESVALDRVHVAATPIVDRTSIDRFGTQITRIGAEQVLNLNASDLASALRRTPGVTITRYNAVGAFGGGEGGAILMRGLGSSRPGGELKATIDGAPKYNAVFNHPLLDLLSVDLAGAIEVHRRATPLVAGNQFAGLNLIAPRARPGSPSLELTASAGSFGAFAAKAEAGAQAGSLDGYVGVSHRRAQGHRPDSAGELNNTLVHLGHAAGPHWQVRYLVNRTDNTAQDPGPVGATGLAQTRGDRYATSDWLHVVTAGWDYARSDGWLKLYHNAGQADWLRRTMSGNADSINQYRLSGVRWRETLEPWTGGEIVLGADYDLARGESVSVPLDPAGRRRFGPREVRLLSGYAGLAQTWQLAPALSVTPSAGVRGYDSSLFPRTAAPQVGLVVQHGTTQWHAGYSRAVNYPGLDVMAFSALVLPALNLSWPQLQPETLDQYEGGVRQEVGERWTVEVTLFRNHGRDRYVWQAPPPRYLNVQQFRTEGVEATVSGRVASTLTVFGGGSWLRSRPAILPYAPRTSLVGGLAWEALPTLTLHLDASYTSEQYAASQPRTASAAAAPRVGAFMLLNARLEWTPAARIMAAGASAAGASASRPRLSVFAAGENLLDRDYAYRPGYPMPGLGGSAGARLRW